MKLLGFVIGFALVVAFQSWIVMLALGAAGHIFEVDRLFVNFWEAGAVSLVLAVIGSFFNRS